MGILSSIFKLPFGQIPEISPQEFHTWLEQAKPVQVVDARTHQEFQQGAVKNARHAPVTDVPASLEKLRLDPAIPVVVCCLSGHRSQPGTRWLCAQGFEAYSLKGGLLAWKQAGYSLEKPARNNSVTQ